MQRQTKGKIIIAIFSIITGLISSLAISTFMYRTIKKLEIKADYFYPHTIAQSITYNQEHRIIFAGAIFLFSLIIVFIVISVKDKNQFASELNIITDKISTPKSVGQLQHGAAKWLSKSDIGKVFFKYTLKNDGMFKALLLQGENDFKSIESLVKLVLPKLAMIPKHSMDNENYEEKVLEVIGNEVDAYISKQQSVKKNSTNKISSTQEDDSIAINQRNKNEKGNELDLSMFIGKSFVRNAGVVIHHSKTKKQENIFCLEKDVHSIILGSTGSSKTRSVILQTVCLLALAGESMVINDPKGEIYQYTNHYLKRLDYNTIVIDFRNRELSQRYNYLQPVINAVNTGDINKAVDLAWDITSSLVGEAKGERIWHDGECCIIASAIICVVLDNKNKPEHQNLTNVYHFIANMCKQDDKGVMPLNLYLKDMEDTHPAKGILAQAEVAPSRTRGSFLTSALSTLRLFTNPNTYNTTCDSDFNLSDIGRQKTALFIILPDDKTTFYPLASLFVYQMYVELSEKAGELGGRLNVRVNMLLDEFGNFSRIPSIENMLTVSRSKGIRFNLVLQSFEQLIIKYDSKEMANIIKENCGCKIFLKTDELATTKEISDTLGNYTTSSFSRSASTSSTHSSNNSNSMNLISRPLLTTEEVRKIDRPYALVIYSGFDPFIASLPDLSKWSFNTALGMGNEAHNMILRMIRQKERKVNQVRDITLWKVWEKYKASGGEDEGIKAPAVNTNKSTYDLSKHMDFFDSDYFENFDSELEAEGMEDIGKTAEERLAENEKKANREDDIY